VRGQLWETSISLKTRPRSTECCVAAQTLARGYVGDHKPLVQIVQTGGWRHDVTGRDLFQSSSSAQQPVGTDSLWQTEMRWHTKIQLTRTVKLMAHVKLVASVMVYLWSSFRLVCFAILIRDAGFLKFLLCFRKVNWNFVRPQLTWHNIGVAMNRRPQDPGSRRHPIGWPWYHFQLTLLK
jgi:hypothetical protein